MAVPSRWCLADVSSVAFSPECERKTGVAKFYFICRLIIISKTSIVLSTGLVYVGISHASVVTTSEHFSWGER